MHLSKRLFDRLLATLGFILLSPLLIGLVIIIRTTLGRPVFFKQKRPGLDGKPFALLKFRTMSDVRDEQGILLPDAERVTPVGNFLRATSLDELPELINILRGDMSIVGPRPLLMKYLNRYSPSQARRHEVKPGLTGWAQINGRNTLDWDKKFKMDVWYVDNWSMELDIKIIMKTIISVLKQEDINHQGEATMSEFKGDIVSGA